MDDSDSTNATDVVCIACGAPVEVIGEGADVLYRCGCGTFRCVCESCGSPHDCRTTLCRTCAEMWP